MANYSGRIVNVGDTVYFSKFGTTITSGYASKSGTFGTCYGKVTSLYDSSYAFPIVISGKVTAGTGGSFTGCTVKPSDLSKGYQVTVTYNKNGGSSGTSSQTGYVGASLTGSASRSGYAFAGWYTASSGGSKVTTIPANATTYYAHWTGNTYYVQFNGNGNTGGSTAKESFTYGTAKALTANGFTKTGYTFSKWNTNAAGTGTNYNNQQSVSNLTATSGGTVNLYAQWTANAYTVKFNGNGASSGSMADQSFSYDTAQNLTSNAFSKGTAYRFTGWNTSPDGTGTSYSDGESVNNLTEIANGVVTLYAQWELHYIAPTIGNLTTLRYANGQSADDGTQLHIEFSWAVDTIVSSANYATSIKIQYKVRGAATWTTLTETTYSDQTPSSLGGTFSYTSAAGVVDTDTTYDVRVRILDYYGTQISIPEPHATASDFISLAFYTMDFADGGEGIGVGRPAPSTGFAVAMDADFTGDLSGVDAAFSGDETVGGALTVTEGATIGALDDGYGINDSALLSSATIAKWNNILGNT